MSADNPSVSILMNCYNGELYLREAIDSVIAQTYESWELVFWDNQSTDDSAAICRGYGDSRIRYFYSQQHTNLGAARDLALRETRGELVAVLDTDDIWLPTKLERQVPYFRDPQIGIVISDTLFFNGHGKQRRLFRNGPPPQGRVFGALLSNYFVSLETVVLRKKAIESQEHAFDERLSHISDFDLVVRLSATWKLACVHEVLAKWRVHTDSASWREPDRFYREKMEFVHIMDSAASLSNEWSQSRQLFLDKTSFSEAVRRLSVGDAPGCRALVSQQSQSNKKSMVLYALSWMPFVKWLMRFFRKVTGAWV